MRPEIYDALDASHFLRVQSNFYICLAQKKFSLKTSLNENSAAISTPSFCTSVSVIRILTSSSAHAFLREFHFLLQKYFVAVCVRKVNKKNHMTREKIIGDDSFAVTETVSAKNIYFIFLHSSWPSRTNHKKL